MNTDVLFPFGDPVHAGLAGIMFGGNNLQCAVLVCMGFGASIFRRDPAPERKTTGKQIFPGESFGWERGNIISTGTI